VAADMPDEKVRQKHAEVKRTDSEDLIIFNANEVSNKLCESDGGR